MKDKIEEMAWASAVRYAQGSTEYANGYMDCGRELTEKADAFIEDLKEYIDSHRYNIYADEIIGRLEEFLEGGWLKDEEE